MRTGDWIDANVVDYVKERVPSDPVVDWITEQTATLGRRASMQIGRDQVAFMTMLTRTVGVRFAVEIGTFTGTSSLAIARGLVGGGRLLCCDVSEEWTAIARAGWERGEVADRIDLTIAPAIDTLRSLPADTVIDLAFVDADKTGYQAYVDELIPRLRVGGIMLIDNTIWSGRILQPDTDDDVDTAAIKALNDALAADPRVDSVILTIGDGLTMARKR